MNREEAIRKAINIVDYFAKSKEAREDAANIIEVLEQELCDVPDINVGDMISRQAVIGVIERWLECSDYNEAERHIMRAVQSVLYDLPPVNPQPKTGHWIEYDHGLGCKYYQCSICKGFDRDEKGKYCKWCGAKMEVGNG